MRWMKLNTLLLIVLLPSVLLAQAGRKKVLQGNELFVQEKYDEAHNKYRDALIDNPDSPIIYFNLGDTQYKKRKYEEALQEYQKALSADDVLLQSKTYYNMGNTMYRMGRLPESILYYKRALELNPNDLDAKYNLEFVRKQLKDKAQKQPQQNQPGQRQEQQQSGSEDQKDNQNKQDQEQQNKEQQQQEQSQEEQHAQSAQQKEMSKEDAERILDVLKNDEKDVQKERKVTSSGRARVEKDW